MSEPAARRRLILSLLSSALLLPLFTSSMTAAIITVGGTCGLFEALENANDTATGQPNLDCAVGDPSGLDTVILTADVTLDQSSHPPILTTEIVVEGNSFSIKRSAGLFGRLFAINSTGVLTISDVILRGGTSVQSGGAIYNNGSLTLSNVAVIGNTADDGGGIGNSGSVTLIDVTLADNIATDGWGGALYSAGYSPGPATLTNVTITGNSAATSAGGVYSQGPFSCTNCTFSGNETDPVGAADLFCYGATCSLVQSTFAGSSTGAHALSSGNSSGIDISGSLMASATIPDCSKVDAIDDLGGNVVRAGDSSCGEGLAQLVNGLDPVLRDNGGPTMTHALLEEFSGSQAIDFAGNCGLETDQRGSRRDIGAGCDSGAFEQPFCGDLRIFNEIGGVRTEETCGGIIVAAVIYDYSDVMLFAGTEVVFWNETIVGEGVELTVGTDPDLQIVPPN
jgi:hypothetical protein